MVEDQTIRTCSGLFLILAGVGVATPALADVPEALSAYVRARAADGDGRVEAAARNYGAALAQSPGNPVIAIRAFREALAAGDMKLAETSAAAMTAAGVAPADATLLAIAAGVRDRNYTAAQAATDRLKGGPLEFLSPSISGWLALERRGDDPVALVDGETKNVLARRFNAENRALLLIAKGRDAEGVMALRTLIGSESGPDLRITAAQLLAWDGKRDTARAVLSGDDPLIAAERDRLDKGMEPTARYGISRMFSRLAGDIVEGEARPLAIVLGRTALAMDPRNDRARLILAGGLSSDGRQDRALELLDAVNERSTSWPAARAARVTVLSRAGRQADALAIARRASGQDGASVDDAQRYGDLLIDAGHYADAAEAYRTAIKRAGADAGWQLYLQRGGALDRAGNWAEAEPALARAVELAPDQAQVLNYLGYARIERGEDLSEARKMLERASKLDPEDAAITDSLGWAYVRTGDVAKGLPLLEKAAKAEPADVTINEHLGDAYWQVGRRYEARYAWQAAALHADGGDATRIATKLTEGLPRTARKD